jgi:hypothetical protein
MGSIVKFLVAAALAGFAVFADRAARESSPTLDESGHYRYGRRILGGHATRFDDSKMPVSALNALPCRGAEIGAFDEGLEGPGDLAPPCDWLAARRPTIVIGLALVLAAAAVAWRLFGPSGTAVTTALVAFDPTVIAHSALITTDIAGALTILLALVTFGWWLGSPSAPRALLLGLATGAALSAKYTAAYLALVFPLIGGVWWFRGRSGRGVPPVAVARQAALFGASTLFTLNGAFLFEGSFKSLRDIHFESRLFRDARKIGGVARLPLPLPEPFVQGLDRVWHREREGGGSGNIYLLGELRPPGSPGFKSYYLILSAAKLPLPALAILALAAWSAVGALLSNHRGRGAGESEDATARAITLSLFLGALFFAAYFNLMYRAQIGFRFFLVALIPLFVLAGRAGPGMTTTLGRGALLASLVAAQAATAAFASPHFLSYFNLAIDPKETWRIAADSNLDWNQTRGEIEAWLASHPEVREAPAKPVAGRVLVGANQLTGVVTRNRMAWLRASGLEPVAVVAGTHFLFDVPEATAAELLRRFPRPNSPGADAGPGRADSPR